MHRNELTDKFPSLHSYDNSDYNHYSSRKDRYRTNDFIFEAKQKKQKMDVNKVSNTKGLCNEQADWNHKPCFDRDSSDLFGINAKKSDCILTFNQINERANIPCNLNNLEGKRSIPPKIRITNLSILSRNQLNNRLKAPPKEIRCETSVSSSISAYTKESHHCVSFVRDPSFSSASIDNEMD